MVLDVLNQDNLTIDDFPEPLGPSIANTRLGMSQVYL